MKSLIFILAMALATLAAPAALGAPTMPPKPAPPVAPPRPPSLEAACQGVPETESHLAILVSPVNVVRVEELRAGVRLDDLSVAAGNGARVVIEARPFTTADWLERVINCHLVRVAVRGAGRGARSSPLDVGGIAVRVLPGSGELLVDVTAADRNAAREVLARSRALVAAAAR